jgi:copper transport protein
VHRVTLRSVGALILLVVGVWFAPGVARAEATVVSSNPADGSSVATSPTQLTIGFSEDLGKANTVALNCNTNLISLGGLQVQPDKRTIVVQIPSPLPKGTCVASWRVSNTDGQPNGAGNITFNVSNEAPVAATSTSVAGSGVTVASPATTLPTTQPVTPSAPAKHVVSPTAAETGQGPLWLGRVISMLGVIILFGSLFTIASAWPEGVEYLVAVRFIRTMWIIAIVGTVLYVAAATAAATGTSFGAGLNPTNWLDLFNAGASGIAAIALLVFVAGSGWVAFRPDRVIDPATQFAALGLPGLAVAALGFSRTGGDLAVVGVVFAIAHVLAVAIWLGGTVLLARVVLAGPGEEDLVHAVRGFNRISNVAIIVVVVTGLVEAVRLDGGDVFGSGHGRVLLLKTIVVAAMLFVALKARQLVNDRLARAEELSVPMADRLRRAFGTEAAIGIVAVVLSAWLLALTPPNVSTGSSTTYAIERRFNVAEANLDVTVDLTPDTAGLVGLQVIVNAPESGLSGLEIVFTAPPNDQIGTITQPVPLTGKGVAVRPVANGLPMNVAGEWKVQVNAVTQSGVINTDPQTFEIRNADGSAPTTAITIPPVVVVTIPVTTVTK